MANSPTLRIVSNADIERTFTSADTFYEADFHLFDAADYMEGSELHFEIEPMVSATQPVWVEEKLSLWMKTEEPDDDSITPAFYGVLQAFTDWTYVEGEIFSFSTADYRNVHKFITRKMQEGYSLVHLPFATSIRTGRSVTGNVYALVTLIEPKSKDGWVKCGGNVVRFDVVRSELLTAWEENNIAEDTLGDYDDEPVGYITSSKNNNNWDYWDDYGYGTGYGTGYGYGYGAGATTTTRKTTTTAVSKKFENATEDSELVWYAAYGSNLNEERFLRYANKERYTAADKFAPGDFTSVQATAPHRMYFAHHSATWGGGIAFLNDQEETPENSATLRLWLLTRQQFWSLVCQENGGSNYTLDWNKVGVERGFLPTQTGLYSRIVTLGHVDGVPVVTCTARETYTKKLGKDVLPWQYEEMGAIKPPSHSYLNTINHGLNETHRLEMVNIDFLAPAVAPVAVEAPVAKAG